DQCGYIQTVAWKFSDGDARTMDRKRRQDDVDAAAIQQATIHHWTGFVDAPTNLRGNLLSDGGDVIIVAESYRNPFQPAVSLDVNISRTVHHDIADRLIQQQRTKRPVACHVVGNLVREQKLLASRQFESFLVGNLMDDFLDLPPKNFARNGCSHRWLDLLNHPFTQRSLDHRVVDRRFVAPWHRYGHVWRK